MQYERMWARGNGSLSVLAMTHPTGAAVFGASVFLLSVIAVNGPPVPARSIPLALAIVLAQAASGVANDLLDRDIDATSKPWRALPAGFITVREAKFFAVGLFLLGLSISLLVSPASCLLLVLGGAVSLAYSGRLKRTPFSWIPYAVAYPSVPVWVWISMGSFPKDLLGIYLVSFPLVLALHMANQMRDYDEDERLGLRGFVQTLGREGAMSLCFFLLLCGPIPLLLARLGAPYASFLAPVMLAAFVHWGLTIPLIASTQDDQATRFRRIFKALQVSVPLLTITWLLPM